MSKAKSTPLGVGGQITILCYPKCGTCRKAEKWLKENGIEYNYSPIKEENPSYEELIIGSQKADFQLISFSTPAVCFTNLTI